MCNGVQHALSTIFAAFAKAGDVVATEELNYPGIKLLADLHRVHLVGLPIDAEGIRTDIVDSLCRRTNVRFVLCSPTAHNPTTITMSDERRVQLASLARTHGFLVIENDILGMMPVERKPALRDLAPRETIYVTGLSKVAAAGLRLGLIVAPSSLVQPLMSGVRSTTWMPQPLTLEIFSIWVEDGSLDRIVRWHRQEIATRREVAIRLLGSERLRSDPSCYHVWLTLPASWTSDDFVNEAHMRGVSLSPSDTFSIDSDLAPNAARISLGSPNSRERLSHGLAILSGLLRETGGVQRSPCAG
jgi:DNA-binding transcriptional MocR family regulator